MGCGVSRYCWVRIHNRTCGAVPIHVFQEYLTCFSNVKIITINILKLVQQIGGFSVSESGDGVGQVGVRALNDWVKWGYGS